MDHAAFPRKQLLRFIIYGAINYGLMGVLYQDLILFSMVYFLLTGKALRGIGFLYQRISCVFLIAQNFLNSSMRRC